MTDGWPQIKARLEAAAAKNKLGINSITGVCEVQSADIRAALQRVEELDATLKSVHGALDREHQDQHCYELDLLGRVGRLTRERDEARASLAAEREHHHHAHGPNCQEAEAEVKRLEGLILEVAGYTCCTKDIPNLQAEAKRIPVQREESSAAETDAVHVDGSPLVLKFWASKGIDGADFTLTLEEDKKAVRA